MFEKENLHFSPNVIFIDGDYADRAAFYLSVNFERMLERRIPKADLCHWLDCLALDGGIKGDAGTLQVFFVHSAANHSLDNFKPSDYDTELDGIAFRDAIGEFSLVAAAPDETLVEPGTFFLDLLSLVADSADVKNLMVVPAEGDAYTRSRDLLRRVDGKDITLFSMDPQPGGGLRQQMLGYSLMSALGITSEELDKH